MVRRGWKRRRWDLGCEEGSRNLFQYLERESKELALRWILAFPNGRTFHPRHFLSFSFSFPLFLLPFPPFLSVYRTFNESFIPLLYPFRVGVHCEVVWGEACRRRTPDFQPLLLQLEVFKVAEGILWVKLRKGEWSEGEGNRYLADISGGNVSNAICWRICSFARK